MITIKNDRVKQFESDLKHFAKRAYPFATKATLNGAAFEGRKFAQENLRNSMTLRNKFTEKSVLVEMARTLNVSRQQSILGSTAPYLLTQEFGGTKKGKGRGAPVSTSYASGEGLTARPRRRLARKPNKLGSIRLQHTQAAGSRKQRNLLAVKAAAGGGSKFVYMDLGKRKGIFRVLGGKKNPRVKMLWDLSRKTHTIPATPWLQPATQAAARRMPVHYEKALAFQLKRLGLFRNE